MLVSKALSHYLNNHICLSQKDIASSADSRKWFLKRIENVINSRIGEPLLYSGKYGDKFIHFGSFFKGTKVNDIDEYDVLVLIDSNSGIYSSSGVKLGEGQGTAVPNPKYYQKYFKDDKSGISPFKMLNWLKGVAQEIVEIYGGDAPIRDGQAVTAYIKSQNLKIDLVPAGVFVDPQGQVFYNIPDGTSANSWIITSPRLDIEMIDKLAKERKNFRNVIRILKRVRDTYNFQISSFPIEMSVVHHVYKNDWYHDLYIDTTASFISLIRYFRDGQMPDMYNKNQNLLAGVANLTWYADRLEELVQKIQYYHKTLIDEELVKTRIIKLLENN